MWIKILAAALAVSISVIGIIGYGIVREYNQIEEIDYKIIHVTLSDITLSSARFAFTLQYRNDTDGFFCDSLSILFFLEDVYFGTCTLKDFEVKSGTDTLILPVSMTFRGIGRGALQTLVAAWESPANEARFSYHVHYRLKSLQGVSVRFLSSAPVIGRHIDDFVIVEFNEGKTFEVAGMQTVKKAVRAAAELGRSEKVQTVIERTKSWTGRAKLKLKHFFHGETAD